MGMFPKKSCSSSPYAPPASGAPNPERFRLIRQERYAATESGGDNLMLVVEVEYPDAKNFEGRKIMVYQGVRSFTELLRRTGGTCDPHFADGPNAPVARFSPAPGGWEAAVWFASRYGV